MAQAPSEVNIKVVVDVAWKSAEDIKELLKTQGQNGTWNYSPYMMGLYNGLELALASIEGRAPEYKDSPEVWLNTLDIDQPPSVTASPRALQEAYRA